MDNKVELVDDNLSDNSEMEELSSSAEEALLGSDSDASKDTSDDSVIFDKEILKAESCVEGTQQETQASTEDEVITITSSDDDDSFVKAEIPVIELNTSEDEEDI